MSSPSRLPLASEPAADPRVDVAALDDALHVGDLARLSGKTVRALHLYEELDLLHPVGRSKGRYRLYSQDALVRIRWIGKLQEMGLSLHEIRAVAREVEGDAPAPDVAVRMREVYTQKLHETRQQLAKLHALEGELQRTLEYLAECESLCEPERAASACKTCTLRGEPHEEGDGQGCPGALANPPIPDLVRGFHVQTASRVR